MYGENAFTGRQLNGESEGAWHLGSAVAPASGFFQQREFNLQRMERNLQCEPVEYKEASAYSMSWMTMPVRSLGSNQVALGGMMLPVSAMRITCSIVTG